MGALPPGADVRRACMIGDRKFDIEAARKLGMTAVGVNYGFAPAGELAGAGADIVLDTVEALTDWLLEGARPRGKFITLEGSDGCGKSTQISLLKDWLEARGWQVVLTREPGGCPISERIREVLLSLDSTGMSPECEALLYAAARVEHVRRVIEPALNLGKIVICDRFLDSSIAYQAYGRELGGEFVRLINDPALRRAAPDATLLLELDRTSAKARLAKGAPADRLEREQEDFFLRVQRGYEALKAAEPGRIRPIDASRSIEAVFGDVRRAVEAVL
jgi:dTMP kinase